MTGKAIFLLSCLIALVAIGAFFAGRLSLGSSHGSSRIEIITTRDLEEAHDKQEPSSTIQLRASSRGNKYYYPWCTSTFAEENTIYFSSVEEAEKAGYEKAEGCLATETN